MMAKETVKFSISDDELCDMQGTVPYTVQLRLKLNKAGFRFADDGKVCAIINENPQPLGTLKVWHDNEKRTTYYEQRLIIN